MKKIIFIGFLFCTKISFAQSTLSEQEISFNFFRNPSVGLEYRYKKVSVHAGYYLTNFKANTTWEFVKTGLSFWFLPIGKREKPSSFYAQMSYLRGQNRDYKNKNAVSLDLGFRLMIWNGLQARLGIIGLYAKDKNLKINPTPSLNYSLFF
ncbi:hypothetical protein [Flexibacter flexilis]|nr:hypothetical protein [Flexibacter flexilis]